MKKYVLCLREKDKDGKEQIYPIYEDYLYNIDMYTTYNACSNSKCLFNCFPDCVKKFINVYLANDVSFIKKYDFFIRRNCEDIRRGRTDLKVLYSSDSDIVYANKNDIYNALLDMKAKDDDIDEISQLKKDFFNDLYNILFYKESKLSEAIDKNNEANFCGYNRRKSIYKLSSNLKIIARFVYENYELKRSVLILLKTYKKKIDDFYNKKTRLVDMYDLEKRIKERPFKIYCANDIINRMLQEEKDYYFGKNPIVHKKENLVEKPKEKSLKKKSPLENNPDYIKYMARFSQEDPFDVTDDYDDDDFSDDFLGPEKPNDPRYWSIN